MVRSIGVLGLIAGSAVVGLLGGCAGGAPVASPTASVTVRASLTNTPEPTTSAPTSSPPETSAGPKFPAGLPDAAKTHDAKGAQAFVRYYMDQLNAAWLRPDADLLRPLCDSERARACEANLKDAERYELEDVRYDGNAAITKSTQSLSAEAGRQRVLYEGRQLSRKLVNSSGDPVESYRAKPLRFIFYLNWGANGWLITDLRLAA